MKENNFEIRFVIIGLVLLIITVILGQFKFNYEMRKNEKTSIVSYHGDLEETTEIIEEPTTTIEETTTVTEIIEETTTVTEIIEETTTITEIIEETIVTTVASPTSIVSFYGKLSDEDIRLVAAVAEKEDTGSMVEICEVIRNRSQGKGRFGVYDSITAVLIERGQFDVLEAALVHTPSSEAIEVVRKVFIEGFVEFDNIVFFAVPEVDPKSIANGLYFVVERGGHRFYGQN